MNSNSIIILNPADENPHCICESGVLVKYRHGNVTVKNIGQISFALVFRVDQRYEHYNILNNTLVTNTDNMTPKEKHIDRENIYKVLK